ncbi:hypothetical protein R1flu_003618 [Riccia fluitans]|uniref:Uncharacterized protein n=1 Tax=Riccia fluitans TaxID=41844 RepID=A0ABD1Y9I3_9MARC
MEARRSSSELFGGSGGNQAGVGDSQPSYFSQGFNLSRFPIPVMPSAPLLFPFMRPPIPSAPITSLVLPTPAPIPGSFASSSAASQVPPILMSGPSVPPASPEETDHGDALGANRAMIVRNHMLRNKWESTIASYKKVRDWNHGFGNESYEALDQNQRKTEKLPKDFPAEWIELMDSFYGHRPSISPPCVFESLEDPNIGVSPNVIVDPHEQPLPNSEVESQRPVENRVGASTIRHNSSVKRKNANGKAATLLSNSVTTFTTNMLELEKKRDEREEKRIAAIHEIEKRKEERLERSRQMDHENMQALTTAITSLALAIGKAIERQQM